jgi:hypothetical protein
VPSFTAEYAVGANRFQVIIMESANRNESKTMVDAYLRQNGRVVNDIAEGQFALSGSRHGEVGLSWKGIKIWGTIGLVDFVLRKGTRGL